MVQFITVVVVLFKWIDPLTKKLNTLKKMEKMDLVSTFAQVMLVAQLFLIYIVNIPIVGYTLKNHARYLWLIEIFGLNMDNAQPYEFNSINFHVLAICFIIQLSALQRSASRCHLRNNLEKKL
jgi:hypothetical protein